MDGLHDICPSVSMLWVSSKVLAPERRQRGFGASVTATDDNDVEFVGEIHDEVYRERESIITATSSIARIIVFHVEHQAQRVRL